MDEAPYSKEDEEKFIKAYNASEVISRHEPSLFKELQNIEAKGAYFDGLRKGRTHDLAKQFGENLLPDWLEGTDPLKDQFKDNEKDISKGKDDGINMEH